MSVIILFRPRIQCLSRLAMGVERRGALSFSVRSVGDRGAEGAVHIIRLLSVDILAIIDALRAPQHPARRPSFHASSSRFFPGRHCDRSSSFHLEISRAPEAGAMPAYILKVLAPAAQSFIRHSHATLPSAACSPISHFSPKIRKFGGGSQKIGVAPHLFFFTFFH